MSGLFAFPSDSSDDSLYAEYDDEMASPEALLFKHGGWSTLWPTTPQESLAHPLAQKAMCCVCSGKGWMWIIP